MTTFAGNTILFERRVPVRILRPLTPPRFTGVAAKAGRFDGAIPARNAVAFVAGRHLPLSGLRIPGDGRLEEESVVCVQKTASRGSGADVVVQATFAFCSTLRKSD